MAVSAKEMSAIRDKDTHLGDCIRAEDTDLCVSHRLDLPKIACVKSNKKGLCISLSLRGTLRIGTRKYEWEETVDLPIKIG